MSDRKRCAQCGAELPPDAPGGHCLNCLLQLGLSASEPAEKPGDRVGRYKLLQKIGEGGCGVVYMAEQEEPVRRRVALKIIKLGMDTRQVIARFEAERQALALMDHPNIAKVLDAGATETGRPYFVMELVRGIKITEHCDQQRFTTRHRLELFIGVCQAVQHAHQKGIIHRDIKPSNILVTEQDGRAVPKIIDFGIAKATAGQPLTDKTLFTAFEQFIGTPAYMSPEQAGLGKLDVDTRSDIYSLGVLLYELLTGRPPFDSKELQHSAIDEVLRTIREMEPPRPSNKLTTLSEQELTVAAQQRQTEPLKLSHLLCGDLDWIVMKAMEKDRTRRYETANGLARDLERFLSDEAVSARPPSAAYRLAKTIRRNKLAFTAAAAVFLSLVTGVGISTWLFLNERQAHERAVAAEREESRLRTAAQNAELNARQNAYVSDMSAADIALKEENFDLARRLLTSYVPTGGQKDLRTFEWRYLWGVSQGEQAGILVGHSNFVNSVAWSPDAKLIASGSSDHTIKLWNPISGEIVTNLCGHSAAVISVAFSTDGRMLASGGEDGLVRLWDLREPGIIHTLTNASPRIAISGNFLAVAAGGDKWGANNGGLVSLWHYPSMEFSRTLPESGNRVAISRDGRTLATANWNGLVKVWDTESGQELKRFPCQGVMSLAFSSDAKKLIWSAGESVIWIWDLNEARPVVLTRGNEEVARSVDLSFDNDTLAVAVGHVINIWSLASHRIIHRLVGHGREVWTLGISPDGKSLVSGGFDDTIRVWSLANGWNQTVIPNVLLDPWLRAGDPAFSPDGKTLACGSKAGPVRLWNAATCEVIEELGAGEVPIRYSEDGRELLTAEKSFAEFHRWDVFQKTCKSSNVMSEVSWGNAKVVSPDQKLIATARGGAVVLNSVTTGELLYALKGLPPARSLEFSPDSRLLAAGHWDGTAELFNFSTGKAILRMSGFKDAVSSFGFSRDGRFIAAGSWDGSIRIWDIASQAECMKLLGHRAGVGRVIFSNDGRTLISGGAAGDLTVRFWSMATGREVFDLHTPRSAFYLALSADDQILATGGDDGMVQLWRAPALAEIDRATR